MCGSCALLKYILPEPPTFLQPLLAICTNLLRFMILRAYVLISDLGNLSPYVGMPQRGYPYIWGAGKKARLFDLGYMTSESHVPNTNLRQ